MGKRGLRTLKLLIVLFWTSLFVMSSAAEQGRVSAGDAVEGVARLGRRISAAFTDLKLEFRGSMEPWNRIVLVEIDERALVPGAPGRWPWRSEMISALIARAFEAGAKSVGSELPLAEGDPAFAEASRVYGNRFVAGRPSGASPDPDGVSRFAVLEPLEGGKPRASLAYELARNAKGKIAPPLTPLGAMEIGFRGPEGAFPHVSALELLIPGEKFSGKATPQFAGVAKADLLKDAYVLIGRYNKTQDPRPEWSANVLDNLLSGDAFKSGSAGAGFWLVLALLLLGGAFFAWTTASLEWSTMTIAAAGTVVGLGLLDHQFLFSLHKDWGTGFVHLEVVSLAVATLLGRYLENRRQQFLLSAALEKHVAPSVARQLARSPGKLVLSGEKREATVLITRLECFEALTERLSPEHLTAFLREYQAAVTGAILRSKGTIDSLDGGKIIAFWGAPLEQSDHANKGVQAALEILWLAKAKREHFRDRFGVNLVTRLGLDSSSVVVGQLAPEGMFGYRAVGEAVNLASRLSELAKDYGVPAVMTRPALERVQASGETSPHHRVIDELREEERKPLELVELLEERLPAAALGLFTEGRELCREGRWDDAISRLERANQALGGEDGPSKVLLRRCREHRSRVA